MSGQYGYGHTGADVKPGLVISVQQADNLFKIDSQKVVDGINKLVKVPLTQNQFDALVSFAYNLGLGTLEHSSLLIKLNQKNYSGAADVFLLYDHAGGKVVQGLLNRRTAERALFLKK